MARNTRGQYTGKNIITWKISKKLQEIAEDVAIKVKPMVRDELESTLRSEIYASYRPATERGKETQEYNETHKHQKSRPYHHTGLLASKVDAVIEGNMIKAIIRDGQYDNGATTAEVYDYLKFGTTDTPNNDTYDYANGTKFSKYIQQEPHNFESRTRKHMKEYIDKLATDLEQHPEKISDKYKKSIWFK